MLVIQNVTVFWRHYFGAAGIPWDFSMSYYAMVAFWTAAVRQGTFPQWIPFQQMGYPFALQLQSGINYLPLWVFPALNIPYTLHAAIVFQCLHVLAGGIGMYLLGRQVQASRRYAIVAAVAFQFFGGFYSNAEHVDIVRAFAFAPWLLYVFSLDRPAAGLPGRALLIPPVLYLFLTGAYPGNVLAGGVIIALFVGLQFLDAWLDGVAPARLLAPAACVVGLGLIGCGMAVLHLGPVWLYRDQFVRAEQLPWMPRETLGFEHLPGLFLSNRHLPGEISMTSTYVSVPILLFACFTPGTAVKRYRVLLTLGAVAALMAAGDRFALAPLVARIVPALRLSRFPSSDYRVFVAIPLMLLSIRGLRALVEHELPATSMAVRAAFCLAFMIWGVARVSPSIGRDAGLVVAVAAASLLTIALLRRGQKPLTVAGLAAVLLLLAVDAARVLPDIQGWNEPDINAYYARQGWPPYASNPGGRLIASRIFRNLPPARPARIVPAGLVRWSGYLDGRYLTTDLTPNVLRAATVAAANGVYQQYLLKAWSPVLLGPERAAAGTSVVAVPDAEIAARLAGANAIGAPAVRQTRYGVNDIAYQVSLPEARLLVENEMYFPGWRARLTTRAGEVIDARAANGVFRSWLLPPGDYTMEAHFEFPHLVALRLVSAVAALAWLLACVAWRRGARVTDAEDRVVSA